MNNLGGALYQKGDFRGARKLFEDLLSVRKSANDRIGVALAKTNLADVLRLQGDLDPALSLYREALASFKEMGDRSSTASVQLAYARALMATHDFAGARRALQEALATNQEIGAKGDAAMDRLLLTQVSLQEGHPESFDKSIQSSIEELRNEHRGADEMEGLAIAADVLMAQKKFPEALDLVQRAQAIRNTDWLAKFHLSLVSARLEAERGNVGFRRQKLNRLINDAKNAGCASCQSSVLAALSDSR